MGQALRQTGPIETRSAPSARASDADAAAPKHASPASKPHWDDAALRTKVLLTVAIAMVGGLLVGTIEAKLGNRTWPMLIGLAAVAAGVACFALRWVCLPIETLLGALRQVEKQDRPSVLAKLPTHRQDEVGRIARALRKVSADAVRDYHEAQQLRRTLDDRVQRATHDATRRLKQLTMRDALTGLGNRRFMEEHFAALFQSCRDSQTDLICCTIDLDNFKQVNDVCGHATGDALLSFTGELIRGSIRHEDYAVRLGGDEFVILMPGCDVQRAQQLAERLIALFRQHVSVSLPGTVNPSVSVGVASLRRDRSGDVHELIDRADAALYHVKRNGKGCVAGV